MKMPDIKLNVQDPRYQGIVQLLAANSSDEQEEGQYKLKRWLRPVLVDQSGLISGRAYDLDERIPTVKSEVIIPSEFIGKSDDEGYCSLSFSVEPKKDKINVAIKIEPANNQKKLEMLVLCDAVLLESPERALYDGIPLRSHLNHFGRTERIEGNDLYAKSFGATVAALDFMRAVYENMKTTDSSDVRTIKKLALLREGIRYQCMAGVIPSPGTRQDFKRTCEDQLGLYESALRSFFPKDQHLK